MEDKKPTERQIEIVQMVANNATQAEIAVKLNISVRSVENEAKKIRAAFGLKSLPAICVHFYKNRWIL